MFMLSICLLVRGPQASHRFKMEYALVKRSCTNQGFMSKYEITTL